VTDQRVIGVDVGGTKILAGIVDADGQVERHREYTTPTSSQEDLIAALETAVRDLLDDEIRAVGFGVPSRLERGQVVGSVNIPLAGIDLAGLMSRRLGLPVDLENDANVAALAEHRAGAGRGTETMVMVTLGTGCGGGVVIDGRLYRGWAELGHTVVELDGLPCQGACTGRGHLEGYVTGLRATHLAQEAFGPAADAHRLTRLAREGDPQAREIIGGIGRYLGAGIATFVDIFDPEMVVIGGGFGVSAFEWLLEPAREVLRRDALTPASVQVRVVPAQLGTTAGLVGAGLLAFEAA
jgi:glucokinase